jgi:hypothetical protein
MSCPPSHIDFRNTILTGFIGRLEDEFEGHENYFGRPNNGPNER